jgi:hypothetical protein
MIRVATVSAWLAFVWAVAPVAQVASAGLTVTVPLIVVVVGVALEELERHGAGVAGISLTAVAVWGLAVATWGVIGGSVLVLSTAVILMVGGAVQANDQQ